MRNLAMGVACGSKRISVDIHVHRVTNRWGYVATRSPEETMRTLSKSCRKNTGSRSTGCWWRLGSTSARAISLSVRRFQF
jgi:endonuclease III